MKKREPLYTVSGNGNWCRVENISPKIKIEPPYDSQIPLLGIYLKNTLLWKDECISHSVMSSSLIVVHQAPLSMKFSRQEYLSGLLFPSPGDLPNLGSNSRLLHCRWILYHWVTWEAPQKHEVLEYKRWKDIQVQLLSLYFIVGKKELKGDNALRWHSRKAWMSKSHTNALYHKMLHPFQV